MLQHELYIIQTLHAKIKWYIYVEWQYAQRNVRYLPYLSTVLGANEYQQSDSNDESKPTYGRYCIAL